MSSKPSPSRCGLRFECTQCGECCTSHDDYAHVYLTDVEARAAAKLLGLSARAFKRRYTFVDEYGWRQLSCGGESCVLMDPETKRCRVYAARPIQCRTFPFWREFVLDGRWSEEVRSFCEGVGWGRLYSPEEVEARMVEMEESDRE